MRPVHFTYNRSSWDAETSTVLPGSMCDLINGPVIAELAKRGIECSVGREPIDGALNMYSSARSAFDYPRPVDEVSVLMSHGIADKGIRTKLCREFDYTIAPSPMHQRPLVNRIGADRAPILGYPKLDPLLRGEVEPLPRDDRIRVLYAPTQGGGGERKHFDDQADPGIPASRRTSWWRRDEIIERLDPETFDVVECPHPRYTPGHKATFAQYVNADVVIADGGSTLWEAMILGIPIVLPSWLTSFAHMSRDSSESMIYRERIGYHARRRGALVETVLAAASQGQSDAEARLASHALPMKLRGTSAQAHAQWVASLVAEAAA